jgi:hypothetical protein
MSPEVFLAPGLQTGLAHDDIRGIALVCPPFRILRRDGTYVAQYVRSQIASPVVARQALLEHHAWLLSEHVVMLYAFLRGNVAQGNKPVRGLVRVFLAQRDNRLPQNLVQELQSGLFLP